MNYRGSSWPRPRAFWRGRWPAQGDGTPRDWESLPMWKRLANRGGSNQTISGDSFKRSVSSVSMLKRKRGNCIKRTRYGRKKLANTLLRKRHSGCESTFLRSIQKLAGSEEHTSELQSLRHLV